MTLIISNIIDAATGEGYVFKAWDIPTEHSDTTFLADEVIRDLKNTTSPFFYHISFLRPHPPMFVSERIVYHFHLALKL